MKSCICIVTLLPSHPNARLSQNSSVPTCYHLIQMLQCHTKVLFPSYAAVSSILPSHPCTVPSMLPSHPHSHLMFVHAALTYMLMSHATVLSPCYHLIPMLHCHITVLSPLYYIVPMLPSCCHTIISY